MIFLEQHQFLVHLPSALRIVFGPPILLQNVLFHCHETIKCIAVLARFSADTNGINGMVPLLVTEVDMLLGI